MKFKFTAIFSLSFFLFSFSQENDSQKKWLRIGLIYGISSQNTYVKQDSDYLYENTIFKVSSHFNLSKKRNHAWEISIDPSYYRSKHESLNYWHKFYTDNTTNPDVFRAKYMQLKTINEYALNLGILYRYYINSKLSIYAIGNVGPMYIDTDTERMKKGFAFSDIFGFGMNYKVEKLSFDLKTMIRHVSNANLQYPNFGYNAVGFEVGTYYEFN